LVSWTIFAAGDGGATGVAVGVRAGDGVDVGSGELHAAARTTRRERERWRIDSTSVERPGP
jgi:hypothetical protein